MIDKRLCVGMFILGVLGHYSSEEIMQDKDLQYISSVLTKKHFELKNGTSKQRISNNMKELARVKQNWLNHSAVSDNAWKKASARFDKKFSVTTTNLILALLRQSDGVKKYYGFNQKRLDKFHNSSDLKGEYVFSSTKAANKLLDELDSEVSYLYNS